MDLLSTLFTLIFAFDNKKAIYHVYHSMQREQLERYLFDTAGYVMNRFVNRINANIGADEEDVKFIAFFYQCALTQIVLKWVEKGMNEDILTTIHDTQRIFDGNIMPNITRISRIISISS